MSRERPHRPKNMGEVLESFAAAIQDEQKRGLPRFSQEQVKRIEAVVHHLDPEQSSAKRSASPRRSEAPRGTAKRPASPASSAPPTPATQSSAPPPPSRPAKPTKPAQDVKHVASVLPPSERSTPSPSNAPKEQLPWMIDESVATPSTPAASAEPPQPSRSGGAASRAEAVRETQPPQRARANTPAAPHDAPPRSTTSAAAASSQDNAARLKDIRAEMGDCTRCRLCETRTNIVFGDGNPEARLFLIGEAPSRQDDESGRIFSDEAGELLSDMLNAMTLSKDEVYITTILKCRPPNNRAGAREELASCAPFLRQQIEAVQPDVILTLGSQASRLLLGGRFPFAQKRGEWNEWEGIAVMPTLHPGYLLQFPQEKASAWQDLQKVMSRMGLK